MQINDSGFLVTLENRIFNLVFLDNGAKMSPKRLTLLSLVFACICLSKSLLIRNQWYACALATCKLSACIPKCMTTIKRFTFFLHFAKEDKMNKQAKQFKALIMTLIKPNQILARSQMPVVDSVKCRQCVLLFLLLT